MPSYRIISSNFLCHHNLTKRKNYRILLSNSLCHYGTPGMKWGVRKDDNRPKHDIRDKYDEMSDQEFLYALELDRKHEEYPGLSNSLKERVYENFDNNLTSEERSSAIVQDEFENYVYTAINFGHNSYKIIYSERIGEASNWDEQLSDILDVVVGKDWRRYDW